MKILESCACGERCVTSLPTFIARQDQRRTIIVIYKFYDHARIISLYISNMSLLREYSGNRIRRLRMAARESGKTSMCVYVYTHIYIYLYALLPRTCPCKRANSSTWWQDRWRYPLLKSKVASSWSSSSSAPTIAPFSRFRSGNVFVALTLCTHGR